MTEIKLLVDFNNVQADGQLRASRRRLPALAIGQAVTLADEADADSYDAIVSAVEDKSVLFYVMWEARTTQLTFPFAQNAKLVASRATVTRSSERDFGRVTVAA